MAALLRAFGFLVSAIGIEFLRGVGVAAFLVAVVVAWRRWPFLSLVAVAAAGAAVALFLPETSDAAGKVSHGLSNLPFVALVYGVIAVIGYAIGRVMRRTQS